MKIGLALSGGGVRATVFHLGVLHRLAESRRWGDINFLSTVSGGSLCIALVFEKAGQRWPSANEFSHRCLPEIRTLLTSCDLEGQYKRFLLLKPWLLLRGRASMIAKLIREQWGITSNVSQMPDPPRWEICATCYETGKSWRFSRTRMGDYLTNYVISPHFPLAEAAAASAAVPGAIGPLRLDTARFRWHKFAKDGSEPTIEVKPLAAHLTLWTAVFMKTWASKRCSNRKKDFAKKWTFSSRVMPPNHSASKHAAFSGGFHRICRPSD